MNNQIGTIKRTRMKGKICIYFIYSLVLLNLKITTDSQLVPVGEGGGVTHMCMDNERHALVQFMAQLIHPYGYLTPWTGEEADDCCNWSGVTCNNQTGHVTEINLLGYGLSGEISPSLLNLTYVIHLDLSSNHFNGSIPSFIGSMTQLTYLHLGENSFHGTIPTSIGSMTQLRYLHLGENYFHGTIPRSIGSLTELRYLYLFGNSLLNGTIPDLGNLTNLQELKLGYLTNCTVENLYWLSQLSQLEYLDMRCVSLAKVNHWVNVISSLQKLTRLRLGGCELSQVIDPYSSSLSSSSSSSSSSSIVYLSLQDNNLNSSMSQWLLPLVSNRLQFLNLSGNMFNGIPEYLGNLCSLTSLYINNNSVVLSFPDFLKNLSGCTSVTLQQMYASGSHFTGSLPDEILTFSSLRALDLSNNQLNGTISEKVWELPMLIILYVDSNSLRGALSENIRKSKILALDFSDNLLEGVPSEAQMSNNSYVEIIDLGSCKLLGPRFPRWIQTLKNLSYIDLASSRIADTIPVEFWNMWPSRLRYLNLSFNNIAGIVPDLTSNFGRESSRIDLSSNNFYGPIPNVPSTLEMLDLSKNNFYGGISFLCDLVDGFLSFLDLSNNSLTGQVPDCLAHFKELTVLNLGHNNLFGRIPASVEYLIKLEALYLNNNNMSGELPLSLKNCTNLKFLYMGGNRFSGDVPFWIGEELSMLYAISLTSNSFFGTIPLQLCHLVSLKILDLSMNNINGSIPLCINNLTGMVQHGLSLEQNLHRYSWRTPFNSPTVHKSEYANFDSVELRWQGSVREFTSILGLVKSIDLSSNNLTGQIPSQLTNLHNLLVLNLSNNNLTGEIPQKIGEMTNLLTLDLSRNNISGGIPISMSQITSIGYLDVSYNNLSGRIPSGSQLQRFEPSSYTGNAGLCGPPLTKYCPGDRELEAPHVIGESKDDGECNDEFERWFYIGGATGFATGFWIVCISLLLYGRGRHDFFRFMDSLENWVYVKVVVLFCKTARVAHT